VKVSTIGIDLSCPFTENWKLLEQTIAPA